MADTKYVALQSIRHGKIGEQQTAAAQSPTHHGVFTANFDAKEFKRLEALGAIRLATKEDLARVNDDDVIEGTATEVEPALEAVEVDGKWTVQREGKVVEGGDNFATKKEAAAWAKANPDATEALV